MKVIIMLVADQYCELDDEETYSNRDIAEECILFFATTA